MTRNQSDIQAPPSPPVQPVGNITAETLNAIERRTKELARHMQRVAMPELQMLEDVGALIRFARHAKGL